VENVIRQAKTLRKKYNSAFFIKIKANKNNEMLVIRYVLRTKQRFLTALLPLFPPFLYEQSA
jgi:hypothetical protein